MVGGWTLITMLPGAGLALAIGAVLPLTACTMSSSTGAHRTSRITTCGNFGLRAIDGKHTVPLLSCAGSANLNPLPSLNIRSGEVVTIVNGIGAPHLGLIASETVVVINGLQLAARRSGTTLVKVTGWASCNVLQAQPPTAYPLMRITVSPASNSQTG